MAMEILYLVNPLTPSYLKVIFSLPFPLSPPLSSVVTFNITTSGELVVGATDTNITCTVTIDVPVDELQIALFADVVDTVAVEPDPDLDSDFVTVALPVLETQNAGIYICGASVFDNATMTGFNISEMYALNISSKDLLI